MIMDKTIELTLEQLRELIQAPADMLAKQEEILKELKEIREKLEPKEVPNITAPYPPFQPFTCPSNPSAYPPQVWYITSSTTWNGYEFSGKCGPTAQEVLNQTASTTKQILND